MKRLFLLALLLVACGDDDGSTDVGQDTPELDVPADVLSDAELDVPADVNADTQDDAQTDAPDVMDVAPNEGFGAISGPCARLGSELESPNPSFYVTRFDFAMDGFNDPEERTLLTDDAERLLNTPNAGGSSQISEAFALETLVRCENAMLTHTEMEVQYDTSGSITDFRVTIGDTPIGVSVVRAFTFPLGSDYTVERAQQVIGGKLDDILESTANVSSENSWAKQILAVLAPDDMPMESVRAAVNSFSEMRLSNTIVYVIITDGDDEAIY